MIELAPGCRGCLRFGAVSIGAKVVVDGGWLGRNTCGYAPFTVDVPAGAGPRELIVVADNRFDAERTPMHEPSFDFYQHGGILRPARLDHLPDSHPSVARFSILPTSGYREGAVEFRVNVDGPPPDGHVLEFRLDGEVVRQVPCPPPGEKTIFDACVRNPKLWSLESPHLHEAEVRLIAPDGRAVDDAVDSFGLRRVEVIGGKLMLNGDALQLRGFNRHEWHPSCGSATSEAQMASDLALLRHAGCNFVRGCHYHQDQRFLDLCDRMGMLVWEENLGWGQSEQVLCDPNFRDHHRQALAAMVEASMNHPSVILWGFLNEGRSDLPVTEEIYAESFQLIREMDPTRLVTYATNRPGTDRYLSLCDIISLNLYPGWYSDPGHPDPVALIAPAFDTHLADLHARGFADKPVLISEIGVECLYGWRDSHGDFFSEAFQARYLSEACRAALADARFCGIAIWHFADTRTCSGGFALGRPRTFNNKGVLDEFRRTKEAYEAVRKVFCGN